MSVSSRHHSVAMLASGDSLQPHKSLHEEGVRADALQSLTHMRTTGNLRSTEDDKGVCLEFHWGLFHTLKGSRGKDNDS